MNQMGFEAFYKYKVRKCCKGVFASSGIVENLNREILFASFVEFWEQGVVQSFVFPVKDKNYIIP